MRQEINNILHLIQLYGLKFYLKFYLLIFISKVLYIEPLSGPVAEFRVVPLLRCHFSLVEGFVHSHKLYSNEHLSKIKIAKLNFFQTI
jgi:hypothetical protein